MRSLAPHVRGVWWDMCARGRSEPCTRAPSISVLIFVLANGNPVVSGEKQIGMVHLVVTFSVFNVADLLLLDWLVVAIGPRWVILPGTEGSAATRITGFISAGSWSASC